MTREEYIRMLMIIMEETIIDHEETSTAIGREAAKLRGIARVEAWVFAHGPYDRIAPSERET